MSMSEEEKAAMDSEIGELLGDAPVTDDLDASDDLGDAGGTGDESTSGDADSGGEDDSSTTQSGEENVDGDDATDTGGAGSEGGSAEGATKEGEADDGLIVDDIESIRQTIAAMGTPAIEVPKPKLDDDGKEIIENPLDLFKEDVNYITEENLKQIADDPLLLNAAMNNVRRQTAENILQIVPNLISQAIHANTLRQEVHTNFYTTHKELVPYKPYVAAVAKKIAANMPDKSQEEILDAVARSVKASLKLEGKASKDTKAKDKKVGAKPALREGKSSGRQTTTAKKSGLEAEIAAMLD